VAHEDSALPVLADPDTGWKGGTCRVCRHPAMGRQWLYTSELPGDPDEFEHHRIVGEAFLHPGKDDCVHPPELARALRNKS
jgi:hypothetical protein